MKSKIILKNGYKNFKISNKEIVALNDVKISIETGKLYAIMGHSGSGKSTLIQILGLLDTLSSGELIINGKEIKELTDDEKANIRMKEIGFIFQSFYLNPRLKAFENVELPMYINKEIPKKERKEKAIELLNSFGLEKRINHYPRELSGGEQQRVAIARALANNPQFILADEPTGNLDKENEEIVFKMLKNLAKDDKGIVIVSHNEEIKKYADEIFYMDNGKLRRQE